MRAFMSDHTTPYEVLGVGYHDSEQAARNALAEARAILAESEPDWAESVGCGQCSGSRGCDGSGKSCLCVCHRSGTHQSIRAIRHRAQARPLAESLSAILPELSRLEAQAQEEAKVPLPLSCYRCDGYRCQDDRGDCLWQCECP